MEKKAKNLLQASAMERFREYQKLHGKSAPIPAKMVRQIIAEKDGDLKLFEKLVSRIEDSIQKYGP